MNANSLSNQSRSIACVTAILVSLGAGSHIAFGQALQPIRLATPELLPAPSPDSGSPFAACAELTVDALVAQVLKRNPSLPKMIAAWEAASARYPQVTSLDDPMFGATIGPASFGSRTAHNAYKLEASQKIPWHGKLRLRGEKAHAEANAAERDIEEVRLQLIERAKAAYFAYYLATRTLEVNSENLRLLREFKQNAETRYKTGLVPQQDVLQAEVEIGREQKRQLLLVRMQQVAMARMNTLMHYPAEMSLPPPPKTVNVAADPLDYRGLTATALSQRPEVHSLISRIRAAEAALGLAHKEFYPDVEFMAGYDRFWENEDLRTMLGIRMNFPVYCARRHGAVSEAQANLAERYADLLKLRDQIQFEVREAYELVRESHQAVRLYEKTILPAAEENVRAALAAYQTGKIAFLSLIDAQRNSINLRDGYYETIADYFTRLAALERAVAGPMTLSHQIEHLTPLRNNNTSRALNVTRPAD